MSETGHAKNAANFDQVINAITMSGAAYKPTQSLIEMPALQGKATAAHDALNAVNQTASDEVNTVNARAEEFDGFRAYATRLADAIFVNINNAEFQTNAMEIIRKLQGRRAGDKPKDNPLTLGVDESKQTHSVSQQSFDNLTANFAALIALLQTQVYNPNEAEFTLAGLQAKLARMQATNDAAKTAIIAYANARDARDAVLYDDQTGIISLVRLIKKYVGYTYGRDSPLYQQINALKFKKVK